MDLTVESFGVTVRSDIFMDCDGTSCSIGTSGLELIDAGGVLVSGPGRRRQPDAPRSRHREGHDRGPLRGRGNSRAPIAAPRRASDQHDDYFLRFVIRTASIARSVAAITSITNPDSASVSPGSGMRRNFSISKPAIVS